MLAKICVMQEEREKQIAERLKEIEDKQKEMERKSLAHLLQCKLNMHSYKVADALTLHSVYNEQYKTTVMLYYSSLASVHRRSTGG